MPRQQVRGVRSQEAPSHQVITFEKPIQGSAFIDAARATCEALGNQLHMQVNDDGTYIVGQTSDDPNCHLQFSHDFDGSSMHPSARYKQIVVSIHRWPQHDNDTPAEQVSGRRLTQFMRALDKQLIATESER